MLREPKRLACFKVRQLNDLIATVSLFGFERKHILDNCCYFWAIDLRDWFIGTFEHPPIKSLHVIRLKRWLEADHLVDHAP